MASSLKKAIVRTLKDELHWGYLPVSGFVKAGSAVDLLDLSGRVEPIPLSSIRRISFVRDFNLNDPVDPERLARKLFLARPRSEGLWLHLTLAGSEVLEGLAGVDLSLFDGLLQDSGVYLIPPDIRSNTQRLFVPRSAILDLQVLGAILAVSKKPAPAPRSVHSGTAQVPLFPENESS